MNKYLLLVLMLLNFLPYGFSQKYQTGDKAEGGIIVYAEKRSGLVVSEVDLGQNWEEGRKVCNDLSLNGFDDWRLPSVSELKEVYYGLYLKGIGNFGTGFYWLDKENTGVKTLAWCMDFKTGDLLNSHSKTNNKYVIAVRNYKIPK